MHRGAPAPSPEALMRSRYSAFAMGNVDYLLQSWHPLTRPASLTLDADVRWRHLAIEAAPQAASDSSSGTVRFRAVSQQGDEWHQLAELSRFIKQDGHWRYHDGDAVWTRLHPGRNDRCPCGSGRKLKQCCLT
nr:YchJ family metal-binding protein [Alcanivorax quisquiliarum]